MINKKILYVEDEHELREIVTNDLREFFHIFEAGTIDDAFRVINEQAKIDILITDFNLGKHELRNGLDVANFFKSKFPTATIILATGSLLTPTQMNEVRKLNIKFCEKPFQHTILRKMLHENTSQET